MYNSVQCCILEHYSRSTGSPGARANHGTTSQSLDGGPFNVGENPGAVCSRIPCGGITTILSQHLKETRAEPHTSCFESDEGKGIGSVL